VENNTFRETLKNDPKLKDAIIVALHKESQMEEIQYRRYALKAFTEVLHELDEDKFKQVYEIAQQVLPKVSVSLTAFLLSLICHIILI
jgi:hypothetical protein